MLIATKVAAALGFLGVALGAFGAHKLKPVLMANDTTLVWQTAVLYQLIHAVAGLWAAGRNPTVVWIWTVGVIFFSGSLYILAVTNAKWLTPWLGPITPIGGLFFLAGWLMLILKPQA